MFSVFERPNPSTAFTETEIMLDGGSMGAFYPGASTNKYIYAISDHLSNTRVTVSADKVSGAAVVISSATNERQVLARDIFELRRVYGPQGIPNSSLQELIQLNKTMYPKFFKK